MDTNEGKSLVVLQVNCRSVVNKSLNLWNIIEIYNADIVIGTESWLSVDISNAEIFRGDYAVFRRDRGSRGGGVFICVKNCYKSLELWSDAECEMLAVEVQGRNVRDTWEIIGMYRAPGENTKILQKLVERTRVGTSGSRQVIIGGDLNIPQVKWDGEVTEGNGVQAIVNELVWTNNLVQVVKHPTRDNAVLDIFLARPEGFIVSCDVVPGISDHSAVCLKVKGNYKSNSVESKKIYLYRKADVMNLQKYLADNYSAWARIGGSVEEVWNNFKKIIYNCVELYVPFKIIAKNPDPEYYNNRIRKLKRKTRRAYGKRKISDKHYENFKNLSQELLNAKIIAQEGYLATILADENKSWKNFFKYVRRRKGNREEIPSLKDSSNNLVVDQKQKANIFNRYFASVYRDKREGVVNECDGESFVLNPGALRKRIAKIGFNKSTGPDEISGEILKLGGEVMITYLLRLFEITINNSCIPRDWREAIVVPIFKGGSRQTVENYRPVSLTSVVCKQMEHLVAEYIRGILDKNNVIYEGQHGFRKGFSCESQVVSVSQDIADSLDKGTTVHAIIIDFTKAFDLVPHDKLIQKISRLNIDRRVALWIREFLNSRTQRVRIGSNLSLEAEVPSGVPQGSVLGPLLFVVYINDIWLGIESKIRLFADDCIIYREIKNTSDREKMQADLDMLDSWATTNEMKVNPGKCKFISFTRSRKPEDVIYKLGNESIPRVKSCKYLGIVLNEDLGWAEQVNYVVKRAWKALHFVTRVLKKGSGRSRELGYISLVRPILEYGSVCWDPYRLGQIKSLEKVQKYAAKFVKRGRSYSDLTSWEPLEKRREKSRLCALYKAIRGDPSWAEVRARLSKPTYVARKDHSSKIRQRKQRTDVGKFSFVNRTVLNWNKLPAAVLKTFPHSVKNFKSVLNRL